MIEMNELQAEAVAGGVTISLGPFWQGFAGFAGAMGAIGATLSNYYGRDMAIDIVAAGNMGA